MIGIFSGFNVIVDGQKIKIGLTYAGRAKDEGEIPEETIHKMACLIKQIMSLRPFHIGAF